MMILNTNKNNMNYSTDTIEEDLKNNMNYSTNNIEDPKNNIEDPTNNIEDPTNNIEDPNKNIEDPNKNIEDPNKNKKHFFSEGALGVIFAIVYTEFVEFLWLYIIFPIFLK